MKNTLEYLFLIIIYSLNVVAWPSGESHTLQPILEMRLCIQSQPWLINVENYKLPENSLVTGCWKMQLGMLRSMWYYSKVWSKFPLNISFQIDNFFQGRDIQLLQSGVRISTLGKICSQGKVFFFSLKAKMALEFCLFCMTREPVFRDLHCSLILCHWFSVSQWED